MAKKWSRSFVVAVLFVASACGDPAGPTFADDPRLSPARRVVGIAAGFSSTCVLTEVGQVYCWGENRFGEFGTGMPGGSQTPVLGAGGQRFGRIVGTVGTSRVCGIAPLIPVAYCWGYNLNGEVGDGTTQGRLSPSLVAGGQIEFVDIATSYHSCGVSADGAAYCWGSGLGLTPRPVATTVRFRAITTGLAFSCALSVERRAYCWGAVAGDGSSETRATPVAVAGGREFTAISAGEYHVCALTPAGEVYCWGRMDPPFGDPRLAPTRLETSVRFTHIASGNVHSCGIASDGRTYCWRNETELFPVPDDHRFEALSSGKEYSCGYTAGGAAFCWNYGFINGEPHSVRPIPELPVDQ